ncbi:FHA domain-containing protein [Aestuariicella hydrocarbonica]|uniref:FHA domain-containing protein n=1 Tax=Pseudomaricurvus hydrocarbonicus TaxID=1470433 RepID=A0A9E5MQI0_9GAMM|nr:FHA domain-containing protein [Aestuariicella hydrocarbonica]NHO68485.1 FHA domain-containing protein [Aestuariicella hydrocarbonica]
MAFLQQTLQGSIVQCLTLENSLMIGRAVECDLVLDDPLVSARHAIFEIDGSKVRLRDLYSTNGVRVNGEPVTDIELQWHDRVLIGASEFQLLETLSEDLANTLILKKSWIPGVYFASEKSA